MSFSIHFGGENYTLIIETLPNEGETIDLHRGLTLTQRNGILYIDGVLAPSVYLPTVSLVETMK